MSFGLLGFPREPKPDTVTAETRRWLAAEAQRVADDDALVEAARQHRAAVADPADTAKVGDADPTAAHLSRDCPAEDDGWWCTRDRHQHGQHVAGTNALVVAVWPNDADAALVTTAERLGDEVGQRDRQAAITAAAATILAHTWEGPSATGKCRCGWPGGHHPRHVAEQLAATGALGTFAQPGPRPTPRTGSFASGEKRTFADGDD